MDDEEAFGVIADRLGFQFHRADVQFMAALADRLAKFGVTPARATATVYVALHEGCDQMALGRALGINRASTMNAVNELVALGIVERRPGRDRRSNALYLSGAGHALSQEIERITEGHDRSIFGVLTAAERAELRRMLGKILRGSGRKPKAEPSLRKPALRSVK